MTFPHFNRRLHLYLGLALLPWLFMYGLSSIPFAHTQYFERRDIGEVPCGEQSQKEEQAKQRTGRYQLEHSRA